MYPISDDLLEKLEKEDCYFPLDGYDYSQHLRRIDTLKFIPAITEKVTGTGAPLSTPPDRKYYKPEEKELMQTLESDAEYDNLSDDFVQQLNLEPDEINKITWNSDAVYVLDCPANFIGKGGVNDPYSLIEAEKLRDDVEKRLCLYNDSSDSFENVDSNNEEISSSMKKRKELDIPDSQKLGNKESDANASKVKYPSKLSQIPSRINKLRPNELLEKLDSELRMKIVQLVSNENYHGRDEFGETCSNSSSPTKTDDRDDFLPDIKRNLEALYHSKSEEETGDYDKFEREVTLESTKAQPVKPETVENVGVTPKLAKTLERIAKARNLIEILKYSEKDLGRDAPTRNRGEEFDSSQKSDDEKVKKCPTIACIAKRERNETSEKKRQRKSTAKNLKRSIRALKKQNAQLLKEQIKREGLVKKNPYDIQDGVKYVRV